MCVWVSLGAVLHLSPFSVWDYTTDLVVRILFVIKILLLSLGKILDTGERELIFESEAAASNFFESFNSKSIIPSVRVERERRSMPGSSAAEFVTDADSTVLQNIQDGRDEFKPETRTFADTTKKEKREKRKKGDLFFYRDHGKCKIGEGCKFEHAETDKGQGVLNINKQKDGVCFSWRDSGKCRFGDECIFKHGKKAVRATPHKRQGVCHAWRDAGVCKREAACHFSDSHTLSNQGDGKLSNIEKSLAALTKTVSSLAAPQQHQARRITNPRKRKNSFLKKVDAKQCKQYNKGTCSFGDNCCVMHEDCWDYRSGNCTRGACRFAHCN